jgi:hypothetical protein
MNEKNLYLVYSLVIILLLAIAGCVAPPKETPSTSVDVNNPQSGENVGPTPSFVSEVTFTNSGSSAIKPVGYTTYLPATRIPSDITCSIYSKSLFGYNGSAFTFYQKNPPMYINYTVIPTNVTVNKVVSSKFSSDKDKTQTITYSDYSPNSWFEVIVRDNATREIYRQEGFGETKGYSTYLSHTTKVLQSGDLLIELRGNDIRASVSVWVKPIGNFDESRLSEFTNCMYWDEHRDTLVTPIPTTLAGATWTPENQKKQ